ncbi:glycosyltransferase involved in cell wall biosynthesis [Ancylobacter sp. 3268]|uniref:glycosyltransferase family 4 protein n=1 Tax=Ancylobacter sp. 3268 TaxID=2817752 RepID=UPI002855F505|nr:glycosyltransferase family 1 protein [Ancylobacter sp. 3268]MDR6954220.1 glycosyltransferase involved in cell wall biosynthesis [Ancylobacter sp. 3268]
MADETQPHETSLHDPADRAASRGLRPGHAAAAGRILLDLTDVVILISAGGGIGGIIRVVVRLARHATAPDAQIPVTLAFYHPVRKTYLAIDPKLFADDSWTRPVDLRVALGLIGVPVPFIGTRHFDEPVRRFWHIARRRLKNWRAARAERAPAGGPASGWALRPLDLAPGEKLRAAVLGMAWMVPKHIERLRALGADVEIVTLIHDLIPLTAGNEELPNPAFVHWFRHLVRQTTRFLAVSRYTADEVTREVAAMGGHVARIDVVPLAHEFAFDGTPDRSVVPEGEFVVTVGSLGHKRKNLDLLLEVWGLLAERLGPEALPALVIAGAHGRQAARREAAIARHPGLKDKVVLVDRPNDAKLAALYAACLFTVYPSRYEGWGLPVGEAAWFGKLSVCSNVTSIPEVMGPAADYFDPADAEAMAKALEQPIRDRAYLRAREAELAAMHLRSWADVARTLVARLAQ